jgi:GTP-binding protein
MERRQDIRNLAIIAHVDHGKTTLVDAMLRQAGVFRSNQKVEERVMDSMDQERERGITILSKTTAIDYRGTRINLVDTPGHADFGGEVERVLRMVDATLLLVDANEGTMPQTRFVLQKALSLGLRILVVINKIDRPEARPDAVLDDTFDLFCALGASDEQLDFMTVYASAKEGYAALDPGDPLEDLTPLFEMILDHVPPPVVAHEEPLQAQVAILDYDDYLGRIAIGRIYKGTIRKGDRVSAMYPGKGERSFRVSNLMGFLGTSRIDLEEAHAGEIVAFTGSADVTVGDTIGIPGEVDCLPAIQVDPPTIMMTFRSNDSPFSGLEGKFVTSRHIRNRFFKEREHNVSLRIEETDSPEFFNVSGRGVLHLGVFIETLRREGFELQVGAPQVITRRDPETDKLQEPYERVEIQVANEYSGTVIERLSNRGGRMDDLVLMEDGTAKIQFRIPSRGLIGYRSIFLTETRGTGILSSVFSHYGPHVGEITRRHEGWLIVQADCTTVAYALANLESRGVLHVRPGRKVYAGEIIGLNAKDRDLVVNPAKGKKLSNVRASGSDDAIRLTTVSPPTLEESLELIGSDEWVEVTPKSIRIRKRILDHALRKRDEKSGPT